MYVLECGVIEVLERESASRIMRLKEEMTHLVSKNECTKEDALIGPLLQSNLKMGLGPVDVD